MIPPNPYLGSSVLARYSAWLRGAAAGEAERAAEKSTTTAMAPARYRRWCLTALLCALALLACESKNRPNTSQSRVVSLSPNPTEAVFAIGAASQLVGRSRYCDYPPPARQIPSVGGFADPSVEAIIALRPTLVIGARGPAGPQLAQTLRAHGITTYFPPIDSVAQISAMLQQLGKQLGRPTAAAAVARQLDRDVNRIAAWATRQKKVRAVMVIGTNPIVVAGPGGFPVELIRTAGGENVITRGGAYPRVDLERLVALDPDVIIDASVVGANPDVAATMQSRLPQAPGWGELRAIRQGRVRVLRSSAALRPGPRIAAGLADLAQALHDRVPK